MADLALYAGLFLASFTAATLLPAQSEALVVGHEPGRGHMRGIPGRPLPDLPECLERNLEAARLTSPDVRAAGICLNTSGMDAETAQRLCAVIEAQMSLPCTDPYRFGVDSILDLLLCPEPSTLSTIASR